MRFNRRQAAADDEQGQVAMIVSLGLFAIEPSDRALAGWGYGDYPAKMLATYGVRPVPEPRGYRPRIRRPSRGYVPRARGGRR